jgi:hypothetical protein
MPSTTRIFCIEGLEGQLAGNVFPVKVKEGGMLQESSPHDAGNLRGGVNITASPLAYANDPYGLSRGGTFPSWTLPSWTLPWWAAPIWAYHRMPLLPKRIRGHPRHRKSSMSTPQCDHPKIGAHQPQTWISLVGWSIKLLRMIGSHNYRTEPHVADVALVAITSHR